MSLGEQLHLDILDAYLEESQKDDLVAFANMPIARRHILATVLLYGEVQNGGFAQCTCNSTGEIAPEAVEGFRAIGMPGTAHIVQTYIDRFGDDFPRDWELRNARWDQLLDQHEGQDPNPYDFEDLDRQFFDLVDE